jgi:FkbM family methyltransferase
MRVDRVQGHSFVRDWIDADSRVVDLGMNKGLFSREIHLRYGCRPLGVEANPALAGQLCNSPELQCFNYAIASSRADLDFYVDLDNPEASSLTPQSDRVHRVRVPSISLADFLAEKNISAVDLLKVDIEGAEIDLFLDSDEEVLLSIGQICVEFHIFLFKDHRARVAEVRTRMTRLGFLCIDFSRDYEDTLFINQHRRPITRKDTLGLISQKYSSGMKRMVQRTLGRPRNALR